MASGVISSFHYDMSRNRIRFEAYELDLHTGELHKSGSRVPLQDQPARLLSLLATRPGELVTREEIQRELWTEGEFVEFEHAVNTAIRKIRVALDDNAESPRIIETLPKKGYRFIATVEVHTLEPVEPSVESTDTGTADEFALPVSTGVCRILFLLAQIPYIASYLVVFYYWYDLNPVLSRNLALVPLAVSRFTLQVFALIGFAVRVYLVTLVGWGHPRAPERYRKLFPYLFPIDALWVVTPLLVQETVKPLVSMAGMILMAWLIFGQRTLMNTLEQRLKTLRSS